MNRSKLLRSVLAIVLALSVVVSFAACSKNGGEEGGTTNAVDQAAPSDAAKPPVQTFDALMTTVFESSDLKVDVTNPDGEKTDISGSFGNNLSDSNIEIKVSEEMKIIIAGTKVTLSTPEGEQSLDIQTFIGVADLDSVLKEFGIDEPIVDVADGVINNGKIERSAIAYLYDEKLRPVLEDMLKAELDVEVELPTFEDTIGYIREFLNSGISKEALNFTVVEETNGTVTYNVTFNAAKLVEDFGDHVMKHTELLAIAKAFAGEEEGAVEEMFAAFVEEASVIPGGSLQVTISGGRLTKVVCAPAGGDTYTFAITSSKK